MEVQPLLGKASRQLLPCVAQLLAGNLDHLRKVAQQFCRLLQLQKRGFDGLNAG